MAVITTGGTGNWSSASGSGPWTGTTKPASGDSVVIAHNVTLDEDPASGITLISCATASTSLTVSGTRTIPCDVTYSSTYTTGFLVVGTGAALTINGKVTASNSGYAVVTSGTGTVTISNAGGTAIEVTSNGRGISSGSTATNAFTVTGKVVVSGANGGGILTSSAPTSSTVTGDIEATSGTGLWLAAGGTTTFDGVPTSSGLGIAINMASTQTLIWTGTRAIASDCYIIQSGGTLNLTNLTLNVTGVFVIHHKGGAVTTTGTTVVLQSTAGQAAILGQGVTTAFTLEVTGPTLPAAGDVDSTSGTYGYAGSPVTPTCVIPAAADVESGVQYGAGGTEFTGTLPAGTTNLIIHAG